MRTAAPTTPLPDDDRASKAAGLTRWQSTGTETERNSVCRSSELVLPVTMSKSTSLLGVGTPEAKEPKRYTAWISSDFSRRMVSRSSLMTWSRIRKRLAAKVNNGLCVFDGLVRIVISVILFRGPRVEAVGIASGDIMFVKTHCRPDQRLRYSHQL